MNKTSSGVSLLGREYRRISRCRYPDSSPCGVPTHRRKRERSLASVRLRVVAFVVWAAHRKVGGMQRFRSDTPGGRCCR